AHRLLCQALPNILFEQPQAFLRGYQTTFPLTLITFLSQKIIEIEPTATICKNHFVCRSWAPPTCFVELGIIFRALPSFNNGVNPTPCSRNLGAMNKQTRIIRSSIKHQALIGITVKIFIGISKIKIQYYRA